ncbi:hypothetical protein Pan216_17740 [Planctomycetes bacterium Pan216]|uniref:YtxH-like protein n=1 Tax=Kolteria novifilia TaxID=2527975 RepID=A0A518B1R8_9BACT|nr:hypothetical protein Pan216_17740 [Planctomycetes bacterium Pan216]
MLPLKFLLSPPAMFALGAVAANVFKSEGIKQSVRTALRGTIKGGLVLKDQIEAIADNVREELEDVTAEAKAELDSSKDSESTGSPNPGV